MLATKDYTIGQITAQDYRAAAVFEKFGLDFCCKGNRTIEDACERKGLKASAVYAALEQLNEQSGGDQIDFNSWPLDLLIDYIEKKHHRYVLEHIPVLEAFLEKIAAVHGKNHPELIEIRALFIGCAQELSNHMYKEENILFPLIRKMMEAKANSRALGFIPFKTVENPIAMMEHEHDTEGDRFRKIAELTNGYSAPADACATYRAAFAELRAFENDLHKHIHLENNILFPKAIVLEKELLEVDA